LAQRDIGHAHSAFTAVTSAANALIYLADVDSVGTLFKRASNLIDRANEVCTRIGELLKVEASLNSLIARDFGEILGVLSMAPERSLPCRHHLLTQSETRRNLDIARAEQSALLKLRAELEGEWDLNLLPNRDLIRKFVVATSDRHWWSFLLADYRGAKKNLRVMSRTGNKLKPDAVCHVWRKLLELVEGEARFLENKNFKRAFGPFDEGLQTPIEQLLELAQWYDAHVSTISPKQLPRESTIHALWDITPEAFKALKGIEVDGAKPRQFLDICQSTLSDVAKYRQGGPADPQEPLVDLKQELTKTATTLTELYSALVSSGFTPHMLLADGPKVLSLLVEMYSAAAIVENSTEVLGTLNLSVSPLAINPGPIRAALEFVDRLTDSPTPPAVKRWLLNNNVLGRFATLQSWRRRLSSEIRDAQNRWIKYRELGRLSEGKWFPNAKTFENQHIADVILRSERALQNAGELASWLDFIRARENVVEAGLESLVSLAERSIVMPNDILSSYDFILSNSIVHEAFDAHKELSQFAGLTHEDLRAKFAAVDRESIDLYRQRAAALIDQRVVPMGIGTGPVAGFSELSLIQHEIQKQKRHIPVRQLLRRAGRALQSLKPCFMMGPLSVAQYLAPGYMKFDLVVMDEASQLRPEDAVGAVARGGQLVVVGDQQQLPPTSFFDRIGDEEDESETDASISDSESILDVATILHTPVRMLRWHYRSRHGSLIAFSNKEFYKNQLVVFPSPFAKSRDLGVKFIKVKTGTYYNRTNMVEAQRVVDSIIEHMTRRPAESLGVVTLNSPQRDLIEELFEQRLKSTPLAQQYIANQQSLTPFFVKNLENVQGDERDVIYISVTFGPDASGHVYQRFGPINGPHGHRRLNVLFTRARKRAVLFSSMSSENIQTTAGSTRGLRALKGYLQYAETGVLEQAFFSGRDPDSDFEIEVADALRQQGYEVAAQIGISGYFIDLAVKHPTKSDVFILGVECDGARYHSSRSARDRDRLRQSVLESLGWNIHRIWSTDWFKDSAREIARLTRRIKIELDREAANLQTDEWDDDEQEAGLQSNASGPALPGEEEDSLITTEEAHSGLLELRDRIKQETGEHNEETGLLRNALLDLFLAKKPRTREEWMKKIPLDVRLDTDGTQVEKYLPAVLSLLGKLAN
jgi:very-short-patch-repair endonuclease